MAQSATQRVAEKLAARKAAEATPAPVEAEEPDDEATDEEPAKPLTMKQKQELRRQGKAAPKASKASKAPKVINLAQEPDDEDPTSGLDDTTSDGSDTDEGSVEASSDESSEAPKVTKPRKVVTSKAKKPPSAAQLAAREAFAERSRAKAAEKRGEAPASPDGATTKKPVQTPDEVKKSQAEKRKAAKAAAEAEAEAKRGVKRTPTSKPKVVQKASKAAVSRAQRAADAGIGKQPKAASTKKASGSKGDTKAKVHALLAKGKTRRQIMDELNLSYASVHFHSRTYQGDVSSVRGRVFVKTTLDENGKKLGKGKSEQVSRSEAMRREFKGGMEVGDIARKFDVRYQLAYTACRSLMSESDE